MKILKRHLSKISSVFCLALITGCVGNDNSTKESDKIIASVGTHKLTESHLNKILLKNENKLKTKQELVKNWIDREIFYKAAVEDSVIYREEYKELIEQSSKEIAVALFLKNNLEKAELKVSDSEVRNYFDEHLDEFRTVVRSYFIRRVDFDDYDLAKKFRLNAFNTSWSNSIAEMNSINGIISADYLVSEQTILSKQFFRLIKNLHDGEISIIFETEPNKYSVVQLIRKYEKNQTPEIEHIFANVKNRLKLIQKKKFINELVNDLYVKYKVESFKDSL